MTWTLLAAMFVVLALALAAMWHRRADLRRQRKVLAERAAMARRTADSAPIEVPTIDLAKCMGCGTCVTSCPEDGVLALVHGQAAVVNAGACVGHARCVAECPVGAVTLSRGELDKRRDVPALHDDLQAVGTDGLFLVGEITARSLIRTATEQGARTAATIAARVRAAGPAKKGVHDAVIVGAGPGGLACALGCREHGLDFLLLDQEKAIGGTVAKYPRRKLVLTEPIELPLHGRVPKREFEKEELIALWQDLAARHRLPFRGGVAFDRAERRDDGVFVVHTDHGTLHARHVVVAVGRRGSPRRLGVPGEDLPHVAYALLDAASYENRNVLVVGGGDSAAETALALAEQKGNSVAIAYRQDAFFRLRTKNRERLEARIAEGRIEALLSTEVVSIGANSVELVQHGGGGKVALQLLADDVFVMAGGTAPFAQLEKSGISFDPADHPEPAPAANEGSGGGALPAIAAGLALVVLTLGFVLWHFDYYGLSLAARAAHPKHALLRPDRAAGLWFGLCATAAIVANLAYLLRRNQWFGVRFGQLSTWMTAHVATGVLAVALAMLHGAMGPRQTSGGYAFWALVVLLVTGAIGRWFYAWLPRSANGRELELAALRERAEATAAAAGGAFGEECRREVRSLLDRRQWGSTWSGRMVALLGLQWDLWLVLRRLRRSAVAAGLAPEVVAGVLADAKAAHRSALTVAHLEDLRALLGTWRWVHRWLALFMVLILGVHVVVAILRGVLFTGGIL
ncbi:MAG: NAD(P)-binding domain-containing protein [Planctomycetes bacterium]|nr:NAD(P)-binding domain-containing protein [Planctomycetota bacterium]